jgi:hypothetical protein
MLTIFSIPKPFCGHIRVIQRNAIQSWMLLDPSIEVILFGDEEGAAEVCSEFGIRHEPKVKRNEFGTPLINSIFNRAQEIARYPFVCYSNGDIILTGDFAAALARAIAWRQKFLMVGQRWDLDITEPIDFSRTDWAQRLRALALEGKLQKPEEWIDYFAFNRSLCFNMPPFAVGRPLWDDWMIWKVRTSGVAVLDATPSIMAIHQNHDYSHHQQGMQGVREGVEYKRNLALAGNWRHINSIADATHVMKAGAIGRTYRHWRTQGQREWEHVWHPLRQSVLDTTRPLRRRLGLTGQDLARLRTANRDSGSAGRTR